MSSRVHVVAWSLLAATLLAYLLLQGWRSHPTPSGPPADPTPDAGRDKAARAAPATVRVPGDTAPGLLSASPSAAVTDGAPADGSTDARLRALAAELGIEHRGRLPPDQEQRVLARVNRELEGAQRNLATATADSDPTGTVLIMVSLLKYQLASSMLQKGDYLTVAGVRVPSATGDLDPMTMLGAAVLHGEAVSVVFPIAASPGSDLHALKHFSGDLEQQRLQTVVDTFNQLPLETRRSRATEMLEARRQIEELVAAQRRGEITPAEQLRREAEWASRLPPRGTFVIRDTWSLGR